MEGREERMKRDGGQSEGEKEGGREMIEFKG